MPTYKHRLAVDLARGIKGFLNLDVGATRGAVPDPDQFQARLRQSQEQISLRDGQIAALTEQSNALTEHGNALAEQSHTLAEQSQIMREQLENGGHEIKRLRLHLHKLQTGTKRDLPQPTSAEGNGQPSSGYASALYLDLMKRALKNSIYAESRERKHMVFSNVHTMTSFDSLDSVQACVEDVLANDVPGDFIETGVWRGGTSIFMRAALKAHGAEGRTVWVADSFEGLPPPDAEKYPHDAGDVSHTVDELAISQEDVAANFNRYGLLDDNVKFLKGWFSETLPDAPIEKLAVARLDGDMYESTMDALVSLYPKLSVGGYLIVDDYGAVAACRQAVHDYRGEHGIDEEIVSVDQTCVLWKRDK